MQPPPRRVAIVKLGAIGDVVNTLPFVNRLRRGWPETRIHWVIAPLALGLVEGHPAVDEFLPLRVDRPGTWWAFLRELRARELDLAIDLQRILKSGVITWLSGAPERLGFDRARCKEQSFRFTNRHIAPNPAPGVTVAQYLEFADHLGLPASEAEWRLPYERFDPLDAELGRGPRVAVGIGASKPANRWEPERFARLCELLVRELDARVQLCGGPSDRAAAERVLAACGARLGDQVGRLSLKQSAGLIAASELFVGCDTGLLHTAVAVGTPVVALYGAADPQRTGPFGRPDAVIYRPAPCSPCRKRHCHVAGHPCMVAIEPRHVLGQALAALT